METINCWIITEGIAGTENQCIAVAEALGMNYTVQHIGLKWPFDLLCPQVIKKAPQWGINGIDWKVPAPDLIIASGRKAVPVALRFKNSIKVFIQDPKIDPQYFDLVASPSHDRLKGKNVLTTIAAPNRVTDKKLSEAKKQFPFTDMPPKNIAVMIGGNSKSHTMDNAFAFALLEQLMPYLRSGEYGVMITASRRTPKKIRDDLQKLFDYPQVFYWDGAGENPYHAFLAHADYILVTEDSTSMLSDACTTGKPVYRLPLNGGSDKFNRLYDILKEKCNVGVFTGKLEDKTYSPLNDAQLIADNINKIFAKHDSKN